MDMKRIKSCKTICTAVAAVTLVALLAGCNSEDPKEPVASVRESVAASESTGPNVPAPSVPDVPAPSVPDNPGPAPSVPDNPGPTPSVPDDPDPLPPDDTHEHAYTETVTKATCTEDGFTTYTCACGDSYTGEIVNATGHSWSDWVTVHEPTEEATGTAESVCTGCGAVKHMVLDKLIPNHTHSYTGKVTKAATCSAEGVKTFTCSCGSSYTEAIAKTEHRYRGKEVWPTCESKGYTTYTCRDCGHSYRGNYKDIVDHSYSWEDHAPTCEEEGYNLYMCDYCLRSYKADFVPALGHSFTQYTSNGDATCSEDGTKTAVCDIHGCNKKDTVTDTGSALGHDWSTSVVNPTCTDKGYSRHSCKNCGESYKDTYTDSLGHAYKATSVKAPGMTAQGYTTYTCANCGDSYKDDFVPVIPQEEFERMVAEATVKYINQFRKEQGDTEAISLPGLTLVAEYRAVQLQTNFAHSTADLREAYAYYEYGEWHDNTAYGGTQYWSANAKEAIIDGGGGVADADALGYRFAEVLYYSSGHWSYVGSSKYPYIGVGATWSLNGWCICVLQTSTNYG